MQQRLQELSTEDETDLVLDRVVKRYGAVEAVRQVSFTVRRGEFLSFLGPSGCGKTTTLSMIAGFQELTAGRILVRGRRVDPLPPEKRDTGMVFQDYALFPHMTVAQNVAFGLRMRRVPKSEMQERVAQALEQVRLPGFADRMPSQLSGGQKQRVALARALVIRPAILLLDEPFGALDRQLRESMQFELTALQRSIGITTIFVTHDQDEALSMSDRVAVMKDGRVDQLASPHELYQAPETLFVAQFIGKSNAFPAQVRSADRTALLLDSPLGRLRLPPREAPLPAGSEVVCMFRPEVSRLVAAGDAADPAICTAPGQLLQSAFRGSTTDLLVEAGAPSPFVVSRTEDRSGAALPEGPVAVAWPAAETLVFADGHRCR